MRCSSEFACLLIAALANAAGLTATQSQGTEEWREIETKYIFGFTTGSSIGLEGEKEFSVDSFGSFGKRDGRYAATQTKLEFEHTPTQFLQFELGALVSSHSISGVRDLDDRNAINFMGTFAELRYLLIERGPNSPFMVTLSAEPVWRRIDETSGERVRNYELEFRLSADTELVRNRLYFGLNLLYEPEWTRTASHELEKESSLGFSAALAFRPMERLLIGAEVGYFRHYDGIGLNSYTGDALYVGPTLYLQLTRKSFMTAAWGTQVAGHSVEEGGTLNLVDFPRHRARLKFAVEF